MKHVIAASSVKEVDDLFVQIDIHQGDQLRHKLKHVRARLMKGDIRRIAQLDSILPLRMSGKETLSHFLW